MTLTTRGGSVLLVAALVATGAGAGSAQSLETETARLLPRGAVEIGHNTELQTAAEGTELALPFAFEVGLTDRLELLVEPVAYTAIRPKVGPRATGAGDLEVTLTYLVARETAGRPAIAFAGEVKLPTARDSLIGTGKADYALYLIGSRRFGRWDAHANLSYTVVGQPGGAVKLSNIVGAAVALEHPMGKNGFFAEVLVNTAALAGAEPGPGTASAVPEAAGGEIVGTVGVSRWVVPFLKLSASVSYDNNAAFLFRPGFELRFR